MKIRIIKVYEKSGILRIETECQYGKDNLGLSLQSKYLDPVTEKPRYLQEVKSLLEKKYQKELATEKEVDKEIWDTEVDLDEI